MNDKERNRLFRKERSAQLKYRTRIQRDTAAEVRRQLQATERRIRTILNDTPSEYEAWYLPQLQRSIRDALTQFSAEGAATVSAGLDRSWRAGIDLIDKPIGAGGIQIQGLLGSVDTRQLLAMRTFTTGRMADVGIRLADRINTELGLVAIGTQTTGDVISKLSNLLKTGGRSRAITIIRTELGRAYSVAAQERMTQAKQYLPGLQKQWRRSGKIHSRLHHDAADGQRQDADKPFILHTKKGPVSLMHPRDPAAPIAEVINCGCESLPHMAHWEMTNPTKKPFTDLELQSPLKKALQGAQPVSPLLSGAAKQPPGNAFDKLVNSKTAKNKLYDTPARVAEIQKITGASRSEAAALADYTSAGYKDVNHALRNAKPSSSRFTPAQLRGYEASLNSMIDRLPRPTETRLRRVLGNMDRETRAAVLAAYDRIGREITYNEFLSTSAPGGSYGIVDTQVLLEIHAVPGSRQAGVIGALSPFQYEKEVLYKSRSRFRVLDIRELANGVVKIVLEELT